MQVKNNASEIQREQMLFSIPMKLYEYYQDPNRRQCAILSDFFKLYMILIMHLCGIVSLLHLSDKPIQ